MLTWEIRQGDVLERLAEMADGSVHCVVTSPPYWALRDYGIAGQLGLEQSPEEYLEKMVAVFREVRRVLRDDGTLWLNMGDCYNSGGCAGANDGLGRLNNRARDDRLTRGVTKVPIAPNLKAKDLVGMPWRLALALQADGWWLRSDIIWSKPNPMPEPVRDRPTKAHEYLFLLTKAGKYYYDGEAIREPHSEPSRSSGKHESNTPHTGRLDDRTHKEQAAYTVGVRKYNPNGRNRRTVWEIPTQAFAEAHFATFPEKLVEPCILAGTSQKGCCPICGTPWCSVREQVNPNAITSGRARLQAEQQANEGRLSLQRPTSLKVDGIGIWKTINWKPECQCDAQEVACMVLDPFAGSGTVGVVALRHARSFVGIELNPEYCKIAERRIAKSAPMWATHLQPTV